MVCTWKFCYAQAHSGTKAAQLPDSASWQPQWQRLLLAGAACVTATAGPSPIAQAPWSIHPTPTMEALNRVVGWAGCPWRPDQGPHGHSMLSQVDGIGPWPGKECCLGVGWVTGARAGAETMGQHGTMLGVDCDSHLGLRPVLSLTYDPGPGPSPGCLSCFQMPLCALAMVLPLPHC